MHNRKDDKTFHTKQKIKHYTFGLGRHTSENCKKVGDVSAHKSI